MKIKKKISKPVRTLVTEEDVVELLYALSDIGFEDIYKDDIIDKIEYFCEDSYLIFDAKGHYGNIDVIPESYEDREIVDRDIFLSLATQPTKYAIIETNPGFRNEIAKLDIGTFFTLKNADKNHPFYEAEEFVCVSKRTGRIRYNIYDDVFSYYPFNNIIKDREDSIYRNKEVYYPMQW